MEQIEKFRKEEAKRLLEWIRKNQGDWYGITLAFNEENMLIAAEFKDVIRNLRNNGFYQLIVLLLYTNNDKIKSAIEMSILSGISDNWNEELPDKIIDILLDNFKENQNDNGRL